LRLCGEFFYFCVFLCALCVSAVKDFYFLCALCVSAVKLYSMGAIPTVL
jgi:hypothetical protein